MRFLAGLLLVLALASLALADVKVYDKDGRVTEVWRERRGGYDVYNPDWSRKGHVRFDRNGMAVFDKEWRRRGSIKSSPPTPKKPSVKP